MLKLEEFNKRNLLLIKREEFVFCVNLARFVLIFTDQKLTQTVESFTVRTDLTQETKDFVRKL